MKVTTLSKIIDFLLVRALIFVISYLLLTYYLKDNSYTLYISIAVVIIMHVILKSISIKRGAKKALTLEQKKLKSKCISALAINSNADNLDFCHTLILKMNRTAEKLNGYIIFDDGESKHIVLSNFKFSPLINDDIITMYKIAKKQKMQSLIIFCNKISPEALQFTKQLEKIEVCVFDSDSLFLIMKEYDYYPKENENLIEGKVTLKFLLGVMFNKKRFKSYFITALLVFAMAFLSPFKTYYMIVAAICFALSLFCKLNKPFNLATKNTDIFIQKTQKNQ